MLQNPKSYEFTNQPSLLVPGICYIHIYLSVYFQNEFLKLDKLLLKTFNYTCMMGNATFYMSVPLQLLIDYDDLDVTGVLADLLL